MSGFWKGEAIAAGIAEGIAGLRAEADAQRDLDRTRRLVAEREEAESVNAMNLAEKAALREALKKFDPNHPLLTNKLLQEKIQQAGARALAMTNDQNAARAAGASFRIEDYS